MAPEQDEPVRVPRQRNAEPDPVDPVDLDDRLVEDARCGRLSADDPDPLVRLLAALARCPLERGA